MAARGRWTLGPTHICDLAAWRVCFGPGAAVLMAKNPAVRAIKRLKRLFHTAIGSVVQGSATLVQRLQTGLIANGFEWCEKPAAVSAAQAAFGATGWTASMFHSRLLAMSAPSGEVWITVQMQAGFASPFSLYLETT
ncbi:uncharacterized protein RCC_02682 [Ramularia collo-cygni]|uniref:Uncharacterized protein n=1 Tax=Ramularia collo-cygni TaxID=112498 RepID=A0A2D3UX45_9PEZI|nr:uncharacterized protein RCC_02682 [Ramularia collo-cygni]CZT16847.1 uncharacterized protein RCC_02682 [Ramularia collo-cygni]